MTSVGLKQWRKRMGVSQAELAELLEVTIRRFNRWETRAIPVLKVVELALKYIEEKATAEVIVVKNA